MIQVRKLVAVELIFLGPKIVFAEYGFAVGVGLAIGVLSRHAGAMPAKKLLASCTSYPLRLENTADNRSGFSFRSWCRWPPSVSDA